MDQPKLLIIGTKVENESILEAGGAGGAGVTLHKAFPVCQQIPAHMEKRKSTHRLKAYFNIILHRREQLPFVSFFIYLEREGRRVSGGRGR